MSNTTTRDAGGPPMASVTHLEMALAEAAKRMRDGYSREFQETETGTRLFSRLTDLERSTPNAMIPVEKAWLAHDPTEAIGRGVVAAHRTLEAERRIDEMASRTPEQWREADARALDAQARAELPARNYGGISTMGLGY